MQTKYLCSAARCSLQLILSETNLACNIFQLEPCKKSCCHHGGSDQGSDNHHTYVFERHLSAPRVPSQLNGECPECIAAPASAAAPAPVATTLASQ